MAAPAPFVWVQLYYEGKEEPVGQVVLIKPVPDFVTELAKAVKVEKPNALSHCDASDLYVYSPGTKPASEEKKCIRPGMNLQKLIAEYKSKQTPPTSDEFPLIVVAPNKKATPDSDTTSRTDLDDILQFVRQQKEQSETLAISNATKHRFQDVLDQFEIRVDTPTWDNPNFPLK